MIARVDWVEVFSFHQTKPWGLGEGGALVFPARLREYVKAMINFGIDLSREVQVYAGNGKISEVACAMIATRLETRAGWSKPYRENASRIMAIGQTVGLVPIAKTIPYNSTPGHVPFLSSKALSFEDLENDLVVLQKYYRPLDPECLKAADRYARTFSVPCHERVGYLKDSDLRQLLSSYA